MSKMTSEERQKRRNRVAAEALESVAKSEQFNFRMDSDTIKRLYEMAAEQHKPVGALVRDWVVERLNHEQKAPSSADIMQEIQALREQTMSRFYELSEMVMALGGASLCREPQPTEPPLPQGARPSTPQAKNVLVTAAMQPMPFVCLTERNYIKAGLLDYTSESFLQMAGSVPMPVPRLPSYAVAQRIPRAKLFLLLSSLQPTRPGYIEVPEWLVEKFKYQL